MNIIPWKHTHRIPVTHHGGRHQWAPLFSLQDNINELFDNFFGGTSLLPAFGEERLNVSMPSVDVIEAKKGYKVKVELPGMEAKNVEVSTANGYLTIKGEKREEKEEKDENYIRQESSYGSFHRMIALPDAADMGKANASFKNGILTVEIPKKAEAQLEPKKINVKESA